MKSMKYILLVALLAACSDNNSNGSLVDKNLNTSILEEFATNLPQAVYTDLANNAATLYDQVVALQTDGATEEELQACRTSWKACREAYETSESFLFGPVATESIDPRIDTWPVNFTDLDAQLNSDASFTEEYINGLEDALRGFHPIEYIIFGENSSKKAADLTDRDLEYLHGLALNLKTLTANLIDSWTPDVSGNYKTIFTSAGAGSTVYGTQLAAFEEMVHSMIDICDEVANGKIDEVYVAGDSTLEESPFSKNSITDFTNNIKGVQRVYLGKYKTDGKGLEDLVRASNLQLDSDIKTKLNTAIASLQNITDPFGKAIHSQPVQVQNAINEINALKDELENNLLPFVQKHTN